MDIYAYNIMDHYKNPRNFGEDVSCDSSCHEINTSCGDDITVYLKYDGDIVSNIRFIGTGCAISQASVSILTEILKNKTKEFILNFSFEDLKNIIGIEISERRYKCAILGLNAIRNAINKK